MAVTQEIGVVKKELWGKIQEYSEKTNQEPMSCMEQFVIASPMYKHQDTSLEFYQDRLQIIDSLIAGISVTVEQERDVVIKKEKDAQVSELDNDIEILQEDTANALSLEEIKNVVIAEENFIDITDSEEGQEFHVPMLEPVLSDDGHATLKFREITDAPSDDQAVTRQIVDESYEVEDDDSLQLMPANLMSDLPRFRTTDADNLMDKKVYAHYFSSSWDWFLFEYDAETRECYGFVNGFMPELGYFSLDEMDELNKNPQSFESLIERDLSFTETTLREVLENNSYLLDNVREHNPYIWKKYKEYKNNHQEDIALMSDGRTDDKVASVNFDNISVDGQAGGGEKTHAKKNIEALKVLKRAKDGERLSDDDMAKLAQFSGWGSCSEIFGSHKEWADLHTQLEKLQDNDEQNIALETTLTSFYTPQVLSESIWQHLKNVGFDGGNVLEPALGMGNMIRTMPVELQKKSKIDGIEIDSQVSDMAKILMPDVNVINADFGKCSFENGSYDAVVSNVPFGNFDVDGEGNYGSMKIHDYYFMRAMDSLKEGGVCAFITSTGTLDKMSSSVRQAIAEDNQFCGAIRLPNGFFKDQANTDVAVDVIFLRKGFAEDADRQANRDLWCNTQEYEKTGEQLNSWFIDNPQFVLGNIIVGTNQFGQTLKFENNQEISINVLIEKFNELEERFSNYYEPELANKSTNLQVVVKNQNDLMNITQEEFEKLSKNQQEKYLAVLNITKAAKDLLKLETDNENDEVILEQRIKLNDVYNSFVKKNGFLSEKKNGKILELIGEAPFILSLETELKDEKSSNKNKVYKKSDIFNERVIFPKQEHQVENFNDALSVSLLNRGRVDIDYMLSFFDGKTIEDLYSELRGQIFWDLDSGSFVVKDEFVSGNVRKKLSQYQDKNVELNSDMTHTLSDVYENLIDSIDVSVISSMSENERKMYEIFKTEFFKLSDSAKSDLRFSHQMRSFLSQLTSAYPEYKKALRDFQNEGGVYSLEFIEKLYQLNIASVFFDYRLSAKDDNYFPFEDLSDDKIEYIKQFPKNCLYSYDFAFKHDNEDNQWASSARKYFSLLVYSLGKNIYDEDVLTERFDLAQGRTKLDNYWVQYNSRIPSKKYQELLSAFNSYLLQDNDEKFLIGLFDQFEKIPSTGTNKDELNKSVLVSFEEVSRYLEPKIRMFKDYCNIELEKLNSVNENNHLIEYVKDGLEIIETVQPNDLGKDEISVNIGSFWLDESIFKRFAEDVLHLSADFEYIEEKAEWNIQRGSYYGWEHGLTDYSTDDINTIDILRASMNNKAVKVTEEVFVDGKKKRVVNEEKTMLAIEKQLALEDRFKNWIWEKDEIANWIIKTYNERFNSYRVREYDGSNLVLQGLSNKYELYKHQKNAVARSMYSNTGTLFAHVVGAGKTLEFISAVMERKRLGVCNKPLVVVPKHIIGQTASEFYRAYPNANILVPNEKDFSSANRKQFISRIATGNWDAVILSHEQLSKISFSLEYELALLKKRRDEFQQAYERSYYKNNKTTPTMKTLVGQIKKYEKKIDKLVNFKNKDRDNIPFENLGIDMLVVDEAHSFKNLAFPTKHSMVKGINTSSSQRAEDMLMKTDFLRKKFGSKAILFATGTPISNSMSELYTMTRFLSPELLTDLNLASFDEWQSVFSTIETKWEILPEGGGLQQIRRLSSFNNLPELMNVVGCFADIKTADDLEDIIVPDFEEITVSVEPTVEQKQLIDLVYARAQRVRNDQVDPREDNFLKITNDARRLSLDARLLFVSAGIDVTDREQFPVPEGGKLNECVKNVITEYRASEENKGTQLIFCDSSTPASGKWNVYDEIKRCLVEEGIPEDDIAFVHDAKNDNERMKLFQQVQDGDIRILLGSTEKLGTGTNIQNRLVASHDLDCPWRPSDLEQRKGRIVRNGNNNSKVKIYRYVTKGTFDSYLYSLVSNKQHFISQILNRKGNDRTVDDIGSEQELSFAEIASVAMGDTRLKERMELETEIRRLKISQNNFIREKNNNEVLLNVTLPRDIQSLKKDLSSLAENKILLDMNENQKNIEIDGEVYDEDDRGKANDDLYKKAVSGQYLFAQNSILGHYKGFEIVLSRENYSNINAPVVALRNPNNKFQMLCKSCLKPNSKSNVQLLDNVFGRIGEQIENFSKTLQNKNEQLENLKLHKDDVWGKEMELRQKCERFKVLDKELKIAETEYENRRVEEISLDSIIEARNVTIKEKVDDNEVLLPENIEIIEEPIDVKEIESWEILAEHDAELMQQQNVKSNDRQTSFLSKEQKKAMLEEKKKDPQESIAYHSEKVAKKKKKKNSDSSISQSSPSISS